MVWESVQPLQPLGSIGAINQLSAFGSIVWPLPKQKTICLKHRSGAPPGWIIDQLSMESMEQVEPRADLTARSLQGLWSKLIPPLPLPLGPCLAYLNHPWWSNDDPMGKTVDRCWQYLSASLAYLVKTCRCSIALLANTPAKNAEMKMMDWPKTVLLFNGNVMIYHIISLDSKGTQFSEKPRISLLKTCRIPQDFSPDFSRLAAVGRCSSSSKWIHHHCYRGHIPTYGGW